MVQGEVRVGDPSADPSATSPMVVPVEGTGIQGSKLAAPEGAPIKGQAAEMLPDDTLILSSAGSGNVV